MAVFRLGRSRLVFLACLLITGYFVYSAGSAALRGREQAEERDNAARAVAALEEKNEYLGAVRDYVASDAYVEQQARRQLGYIRNGETPFVVLSPPLQEEPRLAGDWWQRLFPR
ncbi:MAG: FtsB family cell division protein [Tepidiformaceae bacterium]